MADVGEGFGRSWFALTVGLIVAHTAEARLVAHDHALISQLTRRNPAAFDQVLDTYRLVIDRGDDEAADVADPAVFLRGGRRQREWPRPD